MFGPSELDTHLRRGLGLKGCCQLCGLGYYLNERIAGQPGLCPACACDEGKPLQDNDPDHDPYHGPRESAEIVVAREARKRAEEDAERMRLALLQHHQFLAAIAGSYGRRPLRLFPRDQSKLASYAIDLLVENFPDVAERIGLVATGESR